MTCRNGKIDGIKIITPFYMEDERGFFLKNFEKDIFAQFGIDMDIYEEFVTCSKQGVIRGLHFQTYHPQGKLISVLKGTIMDVAVDLRKGSHTFGKWEQVRLSDENHESFWVPQGFAHGFEVISKEALISYICVGKFLAEYDTGIRWNDKEIAVKWSCANPILSAKDTKLMNFKEFKNKYGGLVVEENIF